MPATDIEPHIEPATIEDLPQLVELLLALFSEEEDFKPARERLIEATARGLPVYTRGLRLLRDGFRAGGVGSGS